MTSETLTRLFGAHRAFSESGTVILTGLIVGLLAASFAAIQLVSRHSSVSDELQRELFVRWRSWVGLTAIMAGPVLLGAAWVMAAVLALSLLCYREFARATGVFREKTISLFVVLGILLLTFATVDNYARLFFAAAALTVGLIAICTIPQDRPQGYLQRVALGVLGFVLFGYNLGYLGFLANSGSFRPAILLLVLTVGLNDVFAFCCGKLIGGPKLLPNTSPRKTIAGAVGALVLTTVLVATLSHFVFRGTSLDAPVPLLILGMGISVLGQLGDLLISSVKRDLGLKDIGRGIPGHGGLLDRFDSLVLVTPAYFHFLSLHLGPIGADQAQRIVTGG